MQNRNNNGLKTQAQNKGFTVHVGETYVGYMVIGEKNVPQATLDNLQNPENMAAVLAQAELRPFKEKEDQDMSAVDEILASANSNSSVEESVDEPSQATG